MKAQTLKTKIFISFFSVVIIFGFLVSFLVARVIKNDIIARQQRQIKNDLHVANSVLYGGEIGAIKTAFSIIALTADLEKAKNKLGLDYLYIVDKSERKNVESEIVQAAFAGRETGGIRIIGPEELRQMGEAIYNKSLIEIIPTPKARVTQNRTLNKAMAIGYAMPIFDASGSVKSVIYGGKIINRDFDLVDKIRDLVFENRYYNQKPLGTVTIFLSDVRIATNVLDKNGKRAIGTLVSQRVYKKVLEEGKLWLDRAFVVTDWYLTAYEPIRDIHGNIIGMLYVGILEQPFKDIEKKIILSFLAVILLAVVLAAVLSYFLAHAIAHPVTRMLVATRQISGGDLKHRVKIDSEIKELNELAGSFNTMAERLELRQASYLDLIGFVAHELKAVLASTILNAYSLRDGFLGMINFKQRKALDSVTRNLDYLESTVKNFLSLSRIEKGELDFTPVDVCLKEDIFVPSLEAFMKQAAEKGISVSNNIAAGLKVKGDIALLQIVANNLLSNAVKYSPQNGKIILNSTAKPDAVEIEVYNDGRPISQEDKSMLFRRFSRLNTAEGRKAQGTGLGLFITKEIIQKHGGKIWLENKQQGNSFILQLKRGL